MPGRSISNSMVFFSGAGCLLPLLISLNLFFGWIFLKPLLWISVETGLIILMLIYLKIATRRIYNRPRSKGKVIDVEGKVIKQ
jgi:hypothetical protein